MTVESEDHVRLADRIVFPYPETRESQRVLVEDLDDAVGAGLLLVCSAPTGTGKTAAALFPLVRRALAEQRKVFFVTAKNSQQALALDTLRLMLPPGARATGVQIRARARSCPLDGQLCRRPRCRYQERFRARLEESGIIDELLSRGVIGGEEIAARALRARLCPFEVSLSLAEKATVVVSDFNYVFDPRVYLRRFFDKPWDRHLLIIDEAHNLPKRAVEYYSPTIDYARLERAAQACRTHGSGLANAIAELVDDVRVHLTAGLERLSEERDGPPPYVESPDTSFLEATGSRLGSLLSDYGLEAAIGSLPLLSHQRGEQPGIDPLFALLTELQDFCRCAALDPDLFATLWTREGVRTLCLDASPFLRERIEGFHSAICMSATLAPLDFFASALGADGLRCVTLELPSPFPRENRRLVAATSVDTTFKHRSDYAAEIARIIVDTARLRRGNYLAFFSSFAYRDEVVSKLPKGGYDLLLQLPGVPADGLLAKLRQNTDRTLLVCGVQGGVLSEGVDYPGEMAIGVFVIGPGLPKVSVEQELVRAYYERTLGAGFEYAYLLPGLSRSVQAGGRAIRSATDEAFIMLIGRRFGERLYQLGLPGFWREELVTTGDPTSEVAAFWKARDATR
ncbi:MAG: ATP-dependent DNA helicase [Myxococcales bacterium]|nr:ATP-dependent DNA helicase [Myxococcales bacterium]